MRRFVLWLTGHDLLKPKPMRPTSNYVIAGFPAPLWEWRLNKGGQIIHSQTAPNVVHRMMQKIVLGISWRMLPNYGKNIPGSYV